jgi:hypothetical protein
MEKKQSTDVKTKSCLLSMVFTLSPTQFMKTETNSYGFTETSSSFPIGLILGPGLAGGNMIAASSANKKIQH